GLRWRPRGAPAAAGRRGDARLDQLERVPWGLWRGASGTRSTFHLRRLSRRGQSFAAQRDRRGYRCPGRNFRAGPAPARWRATVLERIPAPTGRAGGNAWRKRGSRRHSRRRTLQSRLDERRARPRRFRSSLDRLSAPRGLEGAALGDRPAARPDGDGPGPALTKSRRPAAKRFRLPAAASGKAPADSRRSRRGRNAIFTARLQNIHRTSINVQPL